MSFRILFFTCLFAFAGCQNGRTQPLESKDGEANDNSKFYRAELTPAEVEVGQQAKLVVVLTPGSGFHWNDEYPAKFQVLPPDGVEVGKTEFSTRAKDIEIGKTDTRLTVPAVVHATGQYTLKLTGSFSVCNDTSCKIFRNESLSFAVSGK